MESGIESFLLSSGFPTNTVDLVFATKCHLKDRLYEVGCSRDDLQKVYQNVVSCLTGAKVHHSRYKSYRTADLTCENHENKDVKVYQTVVHHCEEIQGTTGTPCIVGVAFTRDTLPVSVFPCSTDMADVRYVKTASVCLGARGAEMHFESSCANGDDPDADCTHKVFIRIRVGGGMTPPVSTVVRTAGMVTDQLRVCQLTTYVGDADGTGGGG